MGPETVLVWKTCEILIWVLVIFMVVSPFLTRPPR